MTERVLITGIGIVSAVGNDVPSYLNALKKGVSGISENKFHDTKGYRTNLVGQIKNLPTSPLNEEEKHLTPIDHYALHAARDAIENAKLSKDQMSNSKTALVIGNGAPISNLEGYVENKLYGLKARPSKILNYNEKTGAVLSKYLGIKGVRANIMTACSSGASAVGFAADLIAQGYADIAFCGGVEALCYISFSGFNALEALSPGHSKPFDKNRDGINISEGASILILESQKHAQSRKAPVVAEFVSYGLASDAHHVTAPDPGGKGMSLAMSSALKTAKVNPKKINYINAHGTGTKLNDSSETNAVKTVFEDHAYNLSISSIKPMIGHALSAVGAMEAAATALCIQNNFLPPTLNLETPDPECDLDYIPNKSRDCEIEYAMSNSLAFGGNNTSLLLKKWEEINK